MLSIRNISRKLSTSVLPSKEYDIVVVGGGAVGLTLLKQLLKHNTLSIALIEGRPVPSKEEAILKPNNYKNTSARAYALSESSLQTIGKNDMSNCKSIRGQIMGK